MISSEKILILDGETNQALACVRSLGRAGYGVLVASLWGWPLARWSRYCQGCFKLAGQTINAFALMRVWAHTEGVKIVLPLTERACLLCNAERQEWEAAGIEIGCGTNDMLMLAFDKGQTLQLASQCGVRIPPTQTPTCLKECHEAAEQVGFPCVIKPRFSNAWDGAAFLPDRGCAYVYDRDSLDEAVLRRKQGAHWPLIQGYVHGQGKGVFALYDQAHAVAWFAHERLREVRPTGSGSSLRRSIGLEPRIKKPAERLLSKLNWHGPAMVEFRDDGVDLPCLMEVNGRFWTSLQLAIDAGIDFPAMWVSILKRETIKPIEEYVEGITLRWLWGDVKRFLYILAGPPAGYRDSYPTFTQGCKELFGSQLSGTRLETWRVGDPWPALGEWVQGIRGIFAKL
jgi:predicted ATP-grasp superfamily ATP-dependent carboligase